MASVGYGLYTYGKSNYGTPVYHFGAATIAATSNVIAVGTVKVPVLGSATIAAVSSATATGRQIDRGQAVISAVSSVSIWHTD